MFFRSEGLERDESADACSTLNECPHFRRKQAFTELALQWDRKDIRSPATEIAQTGMPPDCDGPASYTDLLEMPPHLVWGGTGVSIRSGV